MRCPICGGTIMRDWEDIQCLACGRSPVPVTAPPLSVRPRRENARHSSLDDDAIARIKTVLALARFGLKADAARQLAAEYGLSWTYIRDIGLGKQVKSR